MNGSLSLEEGLTIVSSVKSGVADLMPWAREKSKKDLKAISIRGFLGWYHKTTVRFAGRQNLSATDMDHVLGAFEYLKLVDRYFETTRLLAGFAYLIQNFPAEETIPPNGSEE